MKRPFAVTSFVLLAACGEQQQSCDYGTGDYTYGNGPAAAAAAAVATTATGPGRIAFVNSSPAPGIALAGCGSTVDGCSARLKIVLSVRPDVDLRAQRLHVALFAEDQTRIECASTTFDLDAGQSFPIEIACPTASFAAATPLRTATMIADVGNGAERISQEWKVSYSFAP
jgi:hypothetical protein